MTKGSRGKGVSSPKSKGPVFTAEMTPAEAKTALQEAIAGGGDAMELTAAYTEWLEVQMRKNGGAASKRTPCPVTRQEFLDEAPSYKLTIATVDGDVVFQTTMDPKAFNTGSFGWGANAAVEVKVQKHTMKAQLGLNLTVANSRTAKDE